MIKWEYKSYTKSVFQISRTIQNFLIDYFQIESATHERKIMTK